jgi:CAAX protease family protein
VAAVRNRRRLALVLAVLGAVNALSRYGPRHTALVLGPAVTPGLVLLARQAGLDWQELGLARGTLRRGARWAAVGATVVPAAYAVAAAVPALRPAFRDTRYDNSPPEALLVALVVVPVGTVLLEETAFRGVLWAWIRRDHGTAAATAWSSVLFGLWHVLPSLGLGQANQAVAAMERRGGAGRLGPTAGAVIVTGLSGVLLCELRRRSGSVLAPAGVHWAVNGFGVLAAAALRRLSAAR